MKRQRVNKASMGISPAKHSMLLATLLAASIFTAAPVNADDSRIEQFFNQVDINNYRGNYSIIDQIGNNNSATVNQSYSASYQRGNFSKIFQFGNFNTANIAQKGGNNFGVILQKGNAHEASITQAGDARELLKANVSQSGSNSYIQISQSGSGYRSINVEQNAFSGNARPVTVETY
ncbi:hypothetical protein L0636_06865 [Halomonas janggokensis]|jgi:minor curlin subunit|uniref:Minor curlin subunit n=1 Tax=Vreelandella janggokensis TaxID=370767 RepID=A0ABT4IVE0_9GAMM|nr:MULTISPECIES: hypothetical protein [Halomonas]MCZ0927640.1 hypothetical protein [Halomonas janggokensis]MCZ0930148.1 hypothetical protein [Halomonas janggokensis]